MTQAAGAMRFSARWRLAVATATLFLFALAPAAAAPVDGAGLVPLEDIPQARFQFDGVLGERVRANIENWLLVAPQKNPGLLDIFVSREANTEGSQANDPHSLVPWAGEFVGKYLTTAALAMRMSDDPRLRQTAANVVDRLAALQAEDGYLGPWPKKEQLLGHWDLWGHYHVMLGLMLWHEQTGDEKALKIARRIADLVCDTFLDTDRRVASVGSEEMNMGILHGLTLLYRKTGEERYLRMAREIVRDFEKAGDYYRQGLAGVEFFRTPKPRWESLHALQGMAEFYRITGDETYRRSFLHHWASLRRFDIHNTGAFSTGEGATGNPFLIEAPPPQGTSIETCCVIAWEAVMIDALRLTADSTIADDIELTTFNAMAGAQHPSGAWCTYDTPMNGRRRPSHEVISFQSRPGAMFLNCCSVNGSRGLGMPAQWGVLRSGDGLTINYYGPMRAVVPLADGTPIDIVQSTDYPLGDSVRLKIGPRAPRQFTLALRIPVWSMKTEVSVNGQPASQAQPGAYLNLKRSWQAGDEIVLHLDMTPRYESGDLQQVDRVSIYRGPILLCTDDRFQVGPAGMIDLTKLTEAHVTPVDEAIALAAGPYPPWLALDVPTVGGKTLRLIDFASAGSTGKGYASWLAASAARPPRPAVLEPADGAAIDGRILRFSWRAPAASALASRRHTVAISDSPTFERTLLRFDDIGGSELVVPADEVKTLLPKTVYYWKVTACNAFGTVESLPPYKRFTIDSPDRVE